jgi:hypothetical protein
MLEFQMTTGITYIVKMNPEGLMSPNLDLNKDRHKDILETFLICF